MKNNYCFINFGSKGIEENPQLYANQDLKIPKREQREIKIEVGDTNYVAPGKYFLELDENNQPVALKIREDDLTLRTVLGGVAELEDNKAVSMDIRGISTSTPMEITPTSGKDGMKKVTITFTNNSVAL